MLWLKVSLLSFVLVKSRILQHFRMAKVAFCNALLGITNLKVGFVFKVVHLAPDLGVDFSHCNFSAVFRFSMFAEQ